MITGFPIMPEVRPNRLSGKVKDEAYHVKYARYCIGAGMGHPLHQNFLLNNAVFWNFYKGNQWILNEDLDTFLMDESGGARNRVKLAENLIRPMVEQWIGNAIRMEFNAKAVNISPYAKTRKEERLQEMLLMTKIGNAMGGGVKKQIQNQYGTGETEDETKELFENYYVDCYVKAINNLLRWSKDRNRFDMAVPEIAKFLSITGLAVHKGYYQNGEQEWNVLDTNFFFWDRGARRPDLKDAGFMGEWTYDLPVDLYEAHQNLSAQAREAIEKFTQNSNNTYAPIYTWMGTTQDRLFKATTYWKDVEKQEFGYVIDRYGEELLTQINVKDEETGKLKEDSYTNDDLIIPQNENYIRFLGRGNIKRTMYVDVLRYCIFTPREVCAVLNSTSKSGEDIVYEWGKAPYQETNALDPCSVEYPYKCQTWQYQNGEILSPIQDAISPQRMLNRSLSATEAIVNNARLSGTVIDANAIDAQDGESAVIRNMNLGKPIILDSKNMGVQNVVGQYNSNVGSNLDPFTNYVQQIRIILQNTIGVNEAMQGAGGKSSDLVGVKELQVQRGTLIQENFYKRITDVMLQTFQSVATQGKRIYADSHRKLAMIVGDEGAFELEITKDMSIEDFRVSIHTAMPDEAQKAEAMNASIQLFQMGLLGDKQVADVWGRGDLTEVGKLMRDFARQKDVAAAMNSRAQAQMQEQAKAEQQQKEQQLVGLALNEAQKERENDLNKIVLKEGFKKQHIAQQNQGKIADTALQGEIDLTLSENDMEIAKEQRKASAKKKVNK